MIGYLRNYFCGYYYDCELDMWLGSCLNVIVKELDNLGFMKVNKLKVGKI